MTIHIVGCAKTKSSAPGLIPARARYTSPLFRLSLAAAEREATVVYIVSAHHGLLQLDTPLEWYDSRLGARTKRERIAFGQRVVDRILHTHGRDFGTVTIWAGATYADPIYSALFALGRRDTRRPLHGLQVGDRLAFLKLGAAPDGLRPT